MRRKSLRVHWTLHPLVWIAVMTAALSANAAPRPELLSISEPTIEGMEPVVRDQLQNALTELRQMLSDSATPADELTEAFGGIGQIYLAYDLVTPAATALENARRLSPEDFRWLYLLASLQQNEGRLEEAARHFEAALTDSPNNPTVDLPSAWILPAWIRLGNVRLDRDEAAAAKAAFESALEVDLESAAAHAGLGKSAALAGDPTLASEHFRRALELQPQANALRYLLAIALRELGQRDAARQELALRGSVEAAFPDPLAQDVLRLATGSGVHLMYGNRALRQGRVDVAIERYRQALEVNPRSSEAHQSLAAALERQGQRDNAIKHYSSALALAPENPSLHYNLGTILVDQGNDAQAMRHFQAALRLSPEYQNARFNLAAVLARNGHYAEAAPLYDELLASEAGDHATRFYAAHTFQSLGQHERANGLLQELLQEDADRPRARLALARGLVALDDRQGARHQLTLVLDSANLLPQQRLNALLELARLDAQQRHWEIALEQYSAVLELDDAHSEAHFGRAMVLLLSERYKEAAGALESSALRLPGDLELQHLLARFLATCPIAAMRQGQRALELAFDLLQRQQRLDIAQTVAMALAEQERFDEAVRWQERVIEQTRQAGNSELLPRLREDLARYRLGFPVEAPWLQPMPSVSP